MSEMVLYGEVISVIDEKLMIVKLEDGKQVFLPWNGSDVGSDISITVRP